MGKLMVGLTRFLLLCALVLVLPTIAAAQPTPLAFNVDSALGWQTTTLNVTAGQQLSFSASGSWTVDFRFFSYVGPDGYPPEEDSQIFQGCKLDPQLPYAKLLARVGDDPSFWAIGSNGAFMADRDGLLAFRIHDGDACLLDNAGSVQVTVTPAPAQIWDTPGGRASNLIVLVHGCCTDAEDVIKDWDSFGTLIAQTIIQNQTPGPWEIVVWDWSQDTHKYNYLFECLLPGGIPLLSSCILSDALTAYNNAELQAANLTTDISPHPYKYIHMIGHSSGARLIDMTAKNLADLYNNVPSFKDRPFIHLTFLDAYTPNQEDSGEIGGEGYGYLEAYPEHYSEHYVDIGFPSTDALLKNAFNFDITGWDHSLIQGWPFGHSWPLNWYKESVTTSELKYGFPLSLEGSGKNFNELVNELAKYTPGKQCSITKVEDLCP